MLDVKGTLCNFLSKIDIMNEYIMNSSCSCSCEFLFSRKIHAVLEWQKLHSVPLNIAIDHLQCDKLINGTTLCFSLQYHINKLSIMSSDNHMNNSEKEVDEVDAALSDLEITLEGGKTSNTLVLKHCNSHFI